MALSQVSNIVSEPKSPFCETSLTLIDDAENLWLCENEMLTCLKCLGLIRSVRCGQKSHCDATSRTATPSVDQVTPKDYLPTPSKGIEKVIDSTQWLEGLKKCSEKYGRNENNISLSSLVLDCN